MLVASFVFAAMGVCVKLAADYFSTSEIVMVRGVIGMLFIYGLMWLRGGTLKTPLAWHHLWRGAVGVTALWLWFYSIALLPLATAVTLNYMSPIWIAAILFAVGWWRRKNRFDWRLVLAIGLSFAGVTLLLRPAMQADQWFGGLLALASGMLAALAYLEVRRLGQMGEPEYRVVFYFSMTSAVAGLFGTLFIETRTGWHMPGATGIALLLAIGLTAVTAQMAMTRAYRLGNTLLTANLQYTGIVFSSIWGVLIWHDAPGWLGWLGIAAILVSGMAATYYNARNIQATLAAAPAASRSSNLQKPPMTVYTTLIAAAELAPHLSDPNWVVLDCRHDLANPDAGRAAWAAGHLPGAQFAHLDHDLSDLAPAADGTFRGRHPLPQRAALLETLRAWGVNDTSQVVAYDAHGGMFAARLWWLLRWLGHAPVAVLDGGLNAWQNAQGALTSALPAARARGNLQARPTLGATVSADEVLANLASGTRTVVDARAPDRFRGENETLDAVGGHIPGARNRFFKDNLQADGRFKEAAQLRTEFGALIAAPAAAIMQCGSGVTACHNLLALEIAGLPGAALYPGSWSEWCADPARPVARGAQ